jgi:hypothetical protein
VCRLRGRGRSQRGRCSGGSSEWFAPTEAHADMRTDKMNGEGRTDDRRRALGQELHWEILPVVMMIMATKVII